MAVDMQRLLQAALISRGIRVLRQSLSLARDLWASDISSKLHLARPSGNW